MSPFFKDSIAALLQCAQRHANYEHSKVQISAFEAINDLVRSASRDTLDVVAQLIMVGACMVHTSFLQHSMRLLRGRCAAVCMVAFMRAGQAKLVCSIKTEG